MSDRDSSPSNPNSASLFTLPTLFLVVGLFVFYVALSLWRVHLSSFPAHGDGCWYDMVARNLALGKGLTENCLWHFAIPRDTVAGPIGNYWNPLCPIIVSAFYKVWGISDRVGSIPPLLTDLAVALFVFFFALRRFSSRTVATFAFLTYTTHSYVLFGRSGGGAPETFLIFFVTFATYGLIRAWEGSSWGYSFAAVFGALGYLARNEGGMSLLAILFVFGYRELYLKRWKVRGAASTAVALLSALALFALLVLPWELRTHRLFGASANAAKYQFFFARDWWDVWSVSQHLTLGNYLALGWKKLAIIKATSYFYKADNFAFTTSWPILIFLPSGLIASWKSAWPKPVLIYFAISFLVMGFLNSIGQQGGWNGIAVFLPYWIPLAFLGIQQFSFSVSPNRQRAVVLFLLLALGVVGYHLGLNVQYAHRHVKAGDESKREVMGKIEEWFKKERLDAPYPVVMTHFPLELSYYTSIPSVKIPTHDSEEVVWEIAARYHAQFLVLIGANPSLFQPLYEGRVKNTHLQLASTIPVATPYENGGNGVQIYRILAASPLSKSH